MKKLLILFLLSTVALAQNNSQDFFVQFNTSKFTKKVPLDSILNHKLFNNQKDKTAHDYYADIISQLDQTQPVVLHGNFTDSIPFIQFSFPLAKNNSFRNIMLKTIEENNQKSTDSIKDQIIEDNNFFYYSPRKQSFTMAWNKEHLVIYSILETFKRKNKYTEADYDTMVDTVVVDSTAVEIEEAEIIETSPIEETTEISNQKQSNTDIEAVKNEDEEDEEITEEPLSEWEMEYQKEQELLKLENQKTQEQILQSLFQNSFSMPQNNKINTNADISTWLNYNAIYKQASSLSSLFYGLKNLQPHQETNASIIGLTTDFFFLDNKVILDQNIEYSEDFAPVMQKIMNRKPNKNIFKYFPTKEPLAYLSYHFNSEEMLKNYPKIMSQSLSNLPLDQQDIELVSDFFSVLIDEKETATILDGDFSFFLHNIEKYQATITETSYDENYEEVIAEKTITKSRPIFSFIFTSTHPKMGNNLINMGLRKKLLSPENDYFKFQSSQEMGALVVSKKEDVFIISNGFQNLNKATTSNFSKSLKKNIQNSNFEANFDVQKFFNRFLDYDTFGSNKENFINTCNHFNNIKCTASKTIKNNKSNYKTEINSNYSNKNVVLQALDLFSLFNN